MCVHSLGRFRLSCSDRRDYSPPGSAVHGILQVRILEWVAISFSRGSSPPRDRTCISCIGKWMDSLPLHHLGSPLSPVQFSCSVVSDSLRPHGLQHSRLPCPSPTPGVCSILVPRVDDAIQPLHPLSPPSPPTFSLSQHQGLFQSFGSTWQPN